jgi:hypothetical protein
MGVEGANWNITLLFYSCLISLIFQGWPAERADLDSYSIGSNPASSFYQRPSRKQTSEKKAQMHFAEIRPRGAAAAARLVQPGARLVQPGAAPTWPADGARPRPRCRLLAGHHRRRVATADLLLHEAALEEPLCGGENVRVPPRRNDVGRGLPWCVCSHAMASRGSSAPGQADLVRGGTTPASAGLISLHRHPGLRLAHRRRSRSRRSP